MTQQDILNLLKNKKYPMIAKEISKELNIGYNSVLTCLRKLRQTNLIKYEEKQYTNVRGFIYWV